MKFIHLADLHLGRRIAGFSLHDDQEHILKQIEEIIYTEQPDAVLIAGDLYDKLTPPEDAVRLLDGFLRDLSEKDITVYLIAGNHDSADRIAFGARLMDRSGIHFSGVFDGVPQRFTLEDEFGPVDIYLLPYLRAAEARRFFPEAEIPDTAAAVQTAIAALGIDPAHRNIVVSHQFVEGGKTSDSERKFVGGTDSVPAECYAPFEYAALGHLHGPQAVGRETVRFAGSPLKYSLSEADQVKSVTVCELGAKGTPVTVRTVSLTPCRDMRRLSGDFETLMKGESDDYLEIELTNDARITDALKKLRTKYPHTMSLSYRKDEETERFTEQRPPVQSDTEQSPIVLFSAFFRQMNSGQEMTEAQQKLMEDLISEIWDRG